MASPNAFWQTKGRHGPQKPGERGQFQPENSICGCPGFFCHGGLTCASMARKRRVLVAAATQTTGTLNLFSAPHSKRSQSTQTGRLLIRTKRSRSRSGFIHVKPPIQCPNFGSEPFNGRDHKRYPIFVRRWGRGEAAPCAYRSFTSRTGPPLAVEQCEGYHPP